MTLGEFKAWFEGFTEAIDKAPTLKQWARIKERVGGIDGAPITREIWVDRWVQPYRPYWSQPYVYSGTGVGFLNTQTLSSNTAQLQLPEFDVGAAMYAAGAAEARSIAA